MTHKLIRIDNLQTEHRNPDTADIDQLSTLEIITRINAEDAQIHLAIAENLADIAALADAIVLALRKGGRLIYVGAGTSGRIGVLDASECPPTFGTDPSQVVGVMAGGDRALRDSTEDAEDDEKRGRSDMIAQKVNHRDIVVGIAASGRTPYTIAALRYAKETGAALGCVVNSPGSVLAKTADYPVVIPVGPEVITGSTRMKSGTAQKMVLNILSTTAMIKLGKVYGNLMVDVQPSNQKLVQRATNIIVELTGSDPQVARQALDHYGSAKAAIFALLSGQEGDQVHITLAHHQGHLKKALEESGVRPDP
jgi:N-acetylmuramic acid 6-phosphate etherase